ncbi:MAG: hypothetical protein ACLQPD_35225 [Desulfomonilaceae bacterium]
MNTEIDGKTFIVFNRDTMKGEFPALFGGPWHWGLEDQDGTLRVSILGLETAQNAMSMMDMYSRAILHDNGDTEYLDRQLTLLPEGIVVDVAVRVLFSCPPKNEDYRQSQSYVSAKRDFVAAMRKELGLSE